MADRLNLLKYSENHWHVYHNLGVGGFQEVSGQLGLARPMAGMSVNAGDIDNDGRLDLYMGTGWMNLSGLVPNAMFLNAGNRFEDVTESSGTGHFRRATAFRLPTGIPTGDLDSSSYWGADTRAIGDTTALFQNPGTSGTRSDQARRNPNEPLRAGAKIVADVKAPDGVAANDSSGRGEQRQLRRERLVELIGLGDANVIDTLTVSWPTSRSTQTFHDVSVDQAVEITEGSESFRVMQNAPIVLAR